MFNRVDCELRISMQTKIGLSSSPLITFTDVKLIIRTPLGSPKLRLLNSYISERSKTLKSSTRVTLVKPVNTCRKDTVLCRQLHLQAGLYHCSIILAAFTACDTSLVHFYDSPASFFGTEGKQSFFFCLRFFTMQPLKRHDVADKHSNSFDGSRSFPGP